MRAYVYNLRIICNSNKLNVTLTRAAHIYSARCFTSVIIKLAIVVPVVHFFKSDISKVIFNLVLITYGSFFFILQRTNCFSRVL